MIGNRGNPQIQNTQGSSAGRQAYQTGARPILGAQNWIALLIEIVRTLKLSELPQVVALVRKIAIKGDQRAAEKLAKRLSSHYYGQVLAPNHFISMERNLDGDILLGFTDDGKRFGLSRQELVRHVLLTGQSGSGKSNSIKLIVVQARRFEIPTIHFDRKGDLEHAVRDGIDSIRWDEMRINPLCPPDEDVSPEEWRNDFAKAFCELNQFFQRGLSIFLVGVDTLFKTFGVYDNWRHWDCKTMVFPTLIDLLELFKSREFRDRFKGQGVESVLSVIDKLESFVVELGPIISCQRGFDIRRFQQEQLAVNYMLDGLSVEYQNFIIVMELIRYAHLFKAHGPRNQLNSLFVFDEAKGIFGKNMQNSFVVKDLVSKVRELGIGIVCADQIPSEISQFLFSNVGTLVMFRHSDGNDLQRLRYSSGATVEQALFNYALKPGEAIVRSMKSKDLIKIKIPFTPVEKFISREEVDRLMAPRLAELHRDVIPAKRPDAPQANNSQKSATAASIHGTELHFLECLARDFDRPSSEIYKEAGLSESAGYRLKQRLLAKKFISELATNLGKDGKRAIFLVPSPEICAQFGIELGSGRGKALHKHFQATLKSEAERAGFVVRIEECVGGNSEGADLGMEKDGRRIAVEVCITSKPPVEAANIEKNFKLGFDAVILSFVDKKVLERTRQLAVARYSDDILKKVRFCLVNQVSETLERV
ncbi:MAG: ATP-binding protein [Acidobacteria bacterium]|nr:ATP-binding protein [Acidobacteriota bacterium]